MTREELSAIGRELHGERWQQPLARDLDVNPRTVRSWAQGRHRIGEQLAAAILQLRDARRPLHHVTLSTGNLTVTPRAHIDGPILAQLRPIIEAGDGEAAGLRIRVRRRGDGAAVFDLGDGAVVCTVCWQDAVSEDAWHAALALHLASGQPRAPIETPPVPWLAVSLLAPLLALPPETIHMLGVAERCVAWALIEGAGPHRLAG